jgi:type IV secretion system protein VirD4
VNKKIIKIILPTIPLLFGLLYGGGYVAQFMRNYSEWQKNGGYMGDGTSPALPSAGIGECLSSIFVFPYGLFGIGICISAIVFLAFMVMKMGDGEATEKDRERNFEYSSKGTYGTAGFMSEKEMRTIFEVDTIKNNDGILLGLYGNKPIFLPKDTFMNKNVAVFGASGSMKSRAYVRNYIFQATRRGESLVITDPKSEMYEDMAVYLENQGYDVKVFNLISPENSDSWNCIADINGDDLMAQTFTDVVIKNTTVGKGDEFWDSASVNLLKALVLYVSVEYDDEVCNMGEAYKLISLRSAAELDAMFSMLDYTHPAFAPYNIFKQASENVRSGIIIGLGARLQVFQNEMIRNITTYNEINLVDAGKKKSAYFCITSDQDSTFDFLASLFFSFLFIRLVRYADNHCEGGKLTVPVNMVLDEFPNIGAIPDFKKKISTTRSRAINISVIFQNLAQLQNRYPDGAWEEILGNCDTQLFLGCTDSFTAKHISDRTGEVTVGVASKTKNLNTWRVSDYTNEYREARSLGKRKLLTPDEVLRLPVEDALVIMRGQKVLKIKKFDYTKHPHSELIVRKKASTHVPEWRKNETHDEVLRKSEDKLSEIPIPVKETEELPKRITLNRPPSASAPKIETQPKNERGEENALKQQRFGKVDRNALKNNNRR